MIAATPIVLISRPEAQSREFAQMLDQDIARVISPVVKIKCFDVDVQPNRYSGFLFSSQNGVMAAANLADLRGRKAYAVGDRTAAAAADIGMIVTSAGGTADDLVDLVKRENPAGPLLFLRGVISRGSISERLNGAGIETDSVTCYDQVPQLISSGAGDVLRGEAPVVIPLFSPRASDLMGKEVLRIGASAPIGLVCMSDAVRLCWSGPKPANCLVVQAPNVDAMLDGTLRQVRGWY